jgi:SPP1 family predicted phage head-tail adaptor
MKLELDQRVQFFRYAEQRSASGARSRALEPVPMGTPDNRVWCNARYPRGLEHIKFGASVVQCSIVIRYRAGLDAGMVAVVDGVHHEIEAVMPDRKAGFVTLTAKTVNLKS